VLTLTLVGCALPRGAAVQREILKADANEPQNFAIYAVTKNTLPSMRSWYRTGGQASHGWLTHSHKANSVTIKPGDQVNLIIWDSDPNSLLTSPEQKQVKMEGVRVSANGEIFLPYLNKFRIAGDTPERARTRIQAMMEKIAPSAQVQLNIVEGKQSEADLVSGVAKPGNYPLVDTHFTVLNLISRGGGVAPTLRNPRVRLNRNGRSYVKPISDLYKNPNLDTVLRGGDKVIVEEDDRYFLALGATGKEAVVYFPGHARSIFTVDLTTADGLFSAGQFAVYPNDTVLVTESPIGNVRTVLSLIGSAFGLVNTASN